MVLPSLSQRCCSIVGEFLGDGLRGLKNATACSLKEVSTGPFVPIVLTNLGNDGAAKRPKIYMNASLTFRDKYQFETQVRFHMSQKEIVDKALSRGVGVGVWVKSRWQKRLIAEDALESGFTGISQTLNLDSLVCIVLVVASGAYIGMEYGGLGASSAGKREALY